MEKHLSFLIRIIGKRSSRKVRLYFSLFNFIDTANNFGLFWIKFGYFVTVVIRVNRVLLSNLSWCPTSQKLLN